MITVFKGFISLVTILCLKCAYWTQTIFNSNKRYHLTSGLWDLCKNAAFLQTSNQMEIWLLRLQGHAKTVWRKGLKETQYGNFSQFSVPVRIYQMQYVFWTWSQKYSSLANVWDNEILKPCRTGKSLSMSVSLVDTHNWWVCGLTRRLRIMLII